MIDQQLLASLEATINGWAAQKLTGLKLYIQPPTSKTYELLNDYAIEPDVARTIVHEAYTNANGVGSFSPVPFRLCAFADGEWVNAKKSRCFSVTPQVDHVAATDGVEADEKSIVRMLAAQNTHSHNVIARLVPAMMAEQTKAMSEMTRAVTESIAGYMESIKQVSANNVEMKRVEIEEMERTSRIGRVNLLFEHGVPKLMDKLGHLIGLPAGDGQAAQTAQAAQAPSDSEVARMLERARSGDEKAVADLAMLHQALGGILQKLVPPANGAVSNVPQLPPTNS